MQRMTQSLFLSPFYQNDDVFASNTEEEYCNAQGKVEFPLYYTRLKGHWPHKLYHIHIHNICEVLSVKTCKPLKFPLKLHEFIEFPKNDLFLYSIKVIKVNRLQF